MTAAEKILIEQMDGMPNCFLRPFKMLSKKPGFRLLDDKYNPYGTVRYNVVSSLVEGGWLVPVQIEGWQFIYKRTDLKIGKYDN